MDKPQYELGPLRAAVLQEQVNIAAFRRAIDVALEKMRELEGYIKQWEEYNEHTSEPTGES